LHELRDGGVKLLARDIDQCNIDAQGHYEHGGSRLMDSMGLFPPDPLLITYAVQLSQPVVSDLRPIFKEGKNKTVPALY